MQPPLFPVPPERPLEHRRQRRESFWELRRSICLGKNWAAGQPLTTVVNPLMTSTYCFRNETQFFSDSDSLSVEGRRDILAVTAEITQRSATVVMFWCLTVAVICGWAVMRDKINSVTAGTRTTSDTIQQVKISSSHFKDRPFSAQYCRLLTGCTI